MIVNAEIGGVLSVRCSFSGVFYDVVRSVSGHDSGTDARADRGASSALRLLISP